MDLVSDDCHEILKAKLGFVNYQLLNYELAPFSEEKSGFMCDHHVLTAEVLLTNLTVHEKFFIKALPADEEHKKLCLETGANFKEESMFTKVIPTFIKYGVNIIKECTPHCYITKPNNFIVMEDLTVKGYKMLPAQEFLGRDAVNTALKSIAKLHACGFILEEKLTKISGCAYRMYDHFRKEFAECFYTDLKPCVEYMETAKISVAAQIELFANESWRIPRQLFKERVINIMDDFENMVMASETFRNTICHGDLWTNNLMFKFEDDGPTDCVLIDLQGYRYSPPAQDVMAFLYFTTDSDFRSKHLTESLDFYYAQLRKMLSDYDVEIEEILSRSDFAKSCDYYEVFAAAQALIAFHSIMIAPKILKEYLGTLGGVEKAFSGDRSADFLEMCEKDVIYRDRQREAIENLQVLCQK